MHDHVVALVSQVFASHSACSAIRLLVMISLVVFGLMTISCVSYAFVTPTLTPTTMSRRNMGLFMGGKKAMFGIFSPAVYTAKFVLGEPKLNKIRGKGIALHSQVITEFCQQYGAYNMRLKLIKKAKKNGDILGFLV